MKRLALTVSAVTLLSSGAVMAQEYGQVVSKSPITQQVQVPQQVCHPEQTFVQPQNSGGGAVLGGIAGNLLGGTIGKGDGRSAARVVGTVLGAVTGNAWESQQNPGYYQTIQQCQTGYVTQQQVIGYNVTYRYGGQLFTEQLAYDPGNMVPVNVQIQSNGYSQSNVYQQPYAYQQPVQVYEARPQSVSVVYPVLGALGMWSIFHHFDDDDHHNYQHYNNQRYDNDRYENKHYDNDHYNNHYNNNRGYY